MLCKKCKQDKSEDNFYFMYFIKQDRTHSRNKERKK
jgi:hypothetical protein